ncbi:hypothetical protein QZM22_16130 [Burkholderia oklahomensis]|uniref:hypothetical protein n=1 Tax=Burkholderia oklahomensis TaxID=342113 RepID=UPI002650D038|nr:hypothetical protein [Burkholderia oklahomensis]MDN7674010.1 hypothetical protein [Burkholderia oklahomensis]
MTGNGWFIAVRTKEKAGSEPPRPGKRGGTGERPARTSGGKAALCIKYRQTAVRDGEPAAIS